MEFINVQIQPDSVEFKLWWYNMSLVSWDDSISSTCLSAWSCSSPSHRLIWEETLLDSLLNFAATPKGLLLLQQTGAINECVSYMFSRFTKKLQVVTNTAHFTVLHRLTVGIFSLLLFHYKKNNTFCRVYCFYPAFNHRLFLLQQQTYTLTHTHTWKLPSQTALSHWKAPVEQFGDQMTCSRAPQLCNYSLIPFI